jgi:hypothetical protein
VINLFPVEIFPAAIGRHGGKPVKARGEVGLKWGRQVASQALFAPPRERKNTQSSLKLRGQWR